MLARERPRRGAGRPYHHAFAFSDVPALRRQTRPVQGPRPGGRRYGSGASSYLPAGDPQRRSSSSSSGPSGRVPPPPPPSSKLKVRDESSARCRHLGWTRAEARSLSGQVAAPRKGDRRRPGSVSGRGGDGLLLAYLNLGRKDP